MSLKKYLLFFFFNLYICSIFAQNFKHELNVVSDNDAYLWYAQDRYYTNGLFLNYRFVNNILPNDNLEKLIFNISAGQKMYNPISGYSPNPFYHDRPFAAYLYGGFASSFFYKNETMLKTELEVGTVGPKALGEKAQKLLHKIIGFYEVRGWEYQIGNDFAVNTAVQYVKSLSRNEENTSDLILETSAKIGTTFDQLSLGLTFRTGKINPIYQSALYHSRISNSNKTKLANEIYFYARPQLDYVIYDATIEGSMFHHNSPITFGIRPLVFSQLVGFNYSGPHFGIDYHIIFKTKEIKSTAKAHQYGSIALSYRF